MITKEFALAGKAIFTVRSGRDGSRYTFKLVAKESQTAGGEPVFFAQLLTGPDNCRDYTYMGMVDPTTGSLRLTAKSKLLDDSLPVKVLRWTLRQVWAGAELPAGYEIMHAGRCGRCGRLLTVPESVQSGLGPECSKAEAWV